MTVIWGEHLVSPSLRRLAFDIPHLGESPDLESFAIRSLT